MNREDLKKHYSENKEDIQSKLKEFRDLRKASDERLFKELCFVILTSRSSAENAWRATEELDDKDLLSEPKRQEIKEVIAENRIQFEDRKAGFILENFKFLSQPTFDEPSKSMKLRARIKPDNIMQCRKWFVQNIKGVGWKGASHFLRNIGYGDSFAILSSHTVSVLFDLDVLKNSKPPNHEESYLNAEEKVQNFGEEIGINIQALDIVLWSYRTGKVFK